MGDLLRIPTDLIFHDIKQLLDPCDYANLINTCTFFVYTIKKRTIMEIHNRLKKILNTKYDSFISIMKKMNCVISGSFIIQCMLNEKWEHSDIDIYVPMQGICVMETPDRYLKTDVDDFMYNVVNYDGCHDNYHGEYTNKIKYVRDYFSDGPDRDIFQIIGVDLDINSMKEFIDNTFDFGICKNIYSFNNEDDIAIPYLGEILGKSTIFTPSGFGSCIEISRESQSDHFTASIERYYKYVKRGFTFKNKSFITYDMLKPYTSRNILIQRSTFMQSCDLNIINRYFSNILHIPIYTNPTGFSKSLSYTHIKCNNKCIVKFLDGTIKHTHLKLNLKHSEIIILK